MRRTETRLPGYHSFEHRSAHHARAGRTTRASEEHRELKSLYIFWDIENLCPKSKFAFETARSVVACFVREFHKLSGGKRPQNVHFRAYFEKRKLPEKHLSGLHRAGCSLILVPNPKKKPERSDFAIVNDFSTLLPSHRVLVGLVTSDADFVPSLEIVAQKYDVAVLTTTDAGKTGPLSNFPLIHPPWETLCEEAKKNNSSASSYRREPVTDLIERTVTHKFPDFLVLDDKFVVPLSKIENGRNIRVAQQLTVSGDLLSDGSYPWLLRPAIGIAKHLRGERSDPKIEALRDGKMLLGSENATTRSLIFLRELQDQGPVLCWTRWLDKNQRGWISCDEFRKGVTAMFKAGVCDVSLTSSDSEFFFQALCNTNGREMERVGLEDCRLSSERFAFSLLCDASFEDTIRNGRTGQSISDLKSTSSAVGCSSAKSGSSTGGGGEVQHFAYPTVSSWSVAASSQDSERESQGERSENKYKGLTW